MSKTIFTTLPRVHMMENTMLNMLIDRDREVNTKPDMSPKEEFKDLLEIYMNSEFNLKKAEAYELKCLRRSMRDYLLAVDEREKITEKLEKLKYKMGFTAKTKPKEEEEEDEYE